MANPSVQVRKIESTVERPIDRSETEHDVFYDSPGYDVSVDPFTEGSYTIHTNDNDDYEYLSMVSASVVDSPSSAVSYVVGVEDPDISELVWSVTFNAGLGHSHFTPNVPIPPDGKVVAWVSNPTARGIRHYLTTGIRDRDQTTVQSSK